MSSFTLVAPSITAAPGFPDAVWPAADVRALEAVRSPLVAAAVLALFLQGPRGSLSGTAWHSLGYLLDVQLARYRAGWEVTVFQGIPGGCREILTCVGEWVGVGAARVTSVQVHPQVPLPVYHEVLGGLLQLCARPWRVA